MHQISISFLIKILREEIGFLCDLIISGNSGTVNLSPLTVSRLKIKQNFTPFLLPVSTNPRFHIYQKLHGYPGMG
jgi:hypothetical protein